MNNIAKLDAHPCRAVTAEEVTHYREHGWVMLRKFMDPVLAGVLLDVARGIFGEDGDSNKREGAILNYFNPENGDGLSHPQIRPLIDHIGKNAKQLMARRSGMGVRWYEDVFIPKLPSSKKAKHGGNGVTNFHQDFISHAVDRSGGMTFWIPLEAYGPSAGTMKFISGSHRMGVLGDFSTYDEGDDALTVFPELRDLPMTEPMTYELGDVTAHSELLVHGGGANLTDKPRWAYTVFLKPADIRWTGAPCHSMDSTGMEQLGPFDDKRYPILGEF